MSRPDRTGRVLRGIGWLGSSSLLQSALRMGMIVFLARLLAPEDYGLIALATAVVVGLDILLRLGIEPALIQRQTLSDTLLSAASSLALVTALAGMALLMAVATPTAHLLGEGEELANLIKLMSVMLPIGALTNVPRALLSRSGEFRFIAVTDLTSYALSSLAVAIPLAIAGFGAWALASAAVAQPLTTMLLLGRRHSPWRRFSFDFTNMRELVGYGIPLTVAKTANFAALHADNVIVGKLLGVEALGTYSRAYALNTMPAALLAQAVDRALFSVMSDAQADKPAIERATLRGLVALLIVFPPVSAFCYVYAEEIVLLLMGNKWGATVAPFKILSLFMYFRLAYKLPDIALLSVGRSDITMRMHIIYSIIVVIGALLGVQYGTSGVAIGVGVAILIQYMQALYQLVCAFGIALSSIIKMHIAALITGFVSVTLLMSVAAITRDEVSYKGSASNLLVGAIALLVLYGLIAKFIGTLFGEHGFWWMQRVGSLYKK